MTDKHLPSLLERHWAESALAIGAVIIAAVSLWVAYDANRTNRELVASESWPFMQVSESDSALGTSLGTMNLVFWNEGIGPAKLETFELFWNGKPQRSPWQLLRTCCSAPVGAAGDSAALAGLYSGIASTSTTRGLVVRPGVSYSFLSYRRNAEDAASWDTLRTHLGDLSFRYCYCSVFEQCWLYSVHFGVEQNLTPPRVNSCPHPAVTYDNWRGHLAG
ncbi:MAG: hypothetical protein ACREUL_14350 [Steroidobacteraceae bacterium]